MENLWTAVSLYKKLQNSEDFLYIGVYCIFCNNYIQKFT